MTIDGPISTIKAFASVALVLLFAPISAWAQNSGSTALAERVRQLEEQLVDMQVVLGTLETTQSNSSQSGSSYAPSGSAPAVGGFVAGSGAGDSARIDGIETQIQALTAQVEQLSRDVRALRSGQQGSAQPSGRGFATAPQAPVTSGSLNDVDMGPAGFGTTTVMPGQPDGIGGILSGETVAPGFGAGPTAKQMYETAYGYMLQQDYGAAETAFREFLERYPNDPLAGNAQYWLGETYYLRGEYKTAATAFLEGYEKHRQNAKAPEALLKLAMSLDRLGQRDAACSSYSELSAQFPNAPDNVRQRAATERRRAGC